MTLLVMLHLASTWTMVGVIWMVQLVHYPLMAHTGPTHSAAYQRLHVQKMSTLVIPVMLTEAVTALGICLMATSSFNHIAWLGLALLGAIWAVTGLVSVPAHDKLLSGFEPIAHRRLLLSNLLRSALWSCRGLIAIQLVLT